MERLTGFRTFDNNYFDCAAEAHDHEVDVMLKQSFGELLGDKKVDAEELIDLRFDIARIFDSLPAKPRNYDKLKAATAA